jgi:hypothetical protein
MNAATQAESAAVTKPAGLDLLRAPVPEHLISPLPKGTKAQNDCPANEKVNCKVCGGWHHPKIRHLDYVGHAATTHLLLDADLKWDWAPLAYDADGLPKFDNSGGLWIKLTVCGVTRLGYGHADKKAHMDAGSREKEVIGDALRNAAIRFGLALTLWSKVDLHAKGEDEREAWFDAHIKRIKEAPNVGALKSAVALAIAEAKHRQDDDAEQDFLLAQADKMALAKPAAPPPPARSDITDDDIPH